MLQLGPWSPEQVHQDVQPLWIEVFTSPSVSLTSAGCGSCRIGAPVPWMLTCSPDQVQQHLLILCPMPSVGLSALATTQ